MEQIQNERKKKENIKHGVRTQRMFNFRLDNDLQTWLNQQPNRGRYINNLIREDMEKHLATYGIL